MTYAYIVMYITDAPTVMCTADTVKGSAPRREGEKKESRDDSLERLVVALPNKVRIGCRRYYQGARGGLTRRRIRGAARQRVNKPMAPVRPGLLLLLFLLWGPLQGASSHAALPAECNPGLAFSAVCAIDAISEDDGESALAGDIWLEDRPFPATFARAEAVERDQHSDGGAADRRSQARVGEVGGRGSTSAITGVLVTLTFGVFGLLLVTRRRFSP